MPAASSAKMLKSTIKKEDTNVINKEKDKTIVGAAPGNAGAGMSKNILDIVKLINDNPLMSLSISIFLNI
jgi:hypothetical protein